MALINIAKIHPFFFAFFLAFASFSLACNKQDLAALLELRNSYPPNTFPASWYSNEDCCLWNYIRCSRRTGRIQRLSINNNNNISGPIPKSVTGLRYLQRLGFTNLANVNGSIPPQLSKLTLLRQLAIGNIPNLVGPVPPQLASLTKLERLSIFNTNVSGPIPSFLSQLTSLNFNYFSGNKFSSIPASLNLGKLTNIGMIDWGSNKLSGSIPPYLLGTGTTAPGRFSLIDNQLSGDIPASFSNKNFDFIFLSNNKLTGNSAVVLFGKWKSTSQIYLDHNKMAFNFSKVEFPANLTTLDISHNKIYGSIPESITELTQLGSLDVSYNELCAKIPSGGSFPQLSPDNFKNNKCLCGAPLPPCK